MGLGAVKEVLGPGVRSAGRGYGGRLGSRMWGM